MGELHSQLRDVISTNPDDAGEAVDIGRGLISSMEAKDMLSAEQAEVFRRKFADDTIIQTIRNTDDPFKAQDLLARDFVKNNLSAADQLVLRKENEENLIDYKAAQWVKDNYTGDAEDARAGVMSISNPKLMAAADKQLTIRIRNEQNDQATNRKKLFDDYSRAVFDREMTTTDIKRDDPQAWDAMGQSARSNLESFELRGSLPTITPFATTMRLHELRNEAEDSRDYKPLITFIEGHSSGMSVGDNKLWTKIAVDGTYPPEVKSALSFQNQVISHIPKKMTEDEKGQFLNSYNQWYMNFQTDKKREPYDSEVDNYLATAALKGAYTDVGVIWDSEEVGAAHEINDVEALELRNQAVNLMTRFNIEPTEEALNRAQSLRQSGTDFGISAAEKYINNNNMEMNIGNLESVASKMSDAHRKVEASLEASNIKKGSDAYGNMFRTFFHKELKSQGL